MVDSNDSNDNDGIRPYGPGKYNTILDSIVDDLAGCGADDSAGDVNDNGYHWILMRGPFKLTGSFVDFTPEVLAEMTATERSILETTAGVIIGTDDFGFVEVEYYSDPEVLAADWKRIEEDQEIFWEAENEETERSVANEDRLIALGFDKGSRGCSQCEALSINGTPCHEAGCPNATKECKGCNARIPDRKYLTYCDSCNGIEDLDNDSNDNDSNDDPEAL